MVGLSGATQIVASERGCRATCAYQGRGVRARDLVRRDSRSACNIGCGESGTGRAVWSRRLGRLGAKVALAPKLPSHTKANSHTHENSSSALYDKAAREIPRPDRARMLAGN